MRKISASGKLYLLLFITSAFIIGIGAYGAARMYAMERNTKLIHFDELLALDYLTTMRYSYTDGVQNTVRACRDGSITADSARGLLTAARKTIDSCWAAYCHTYLTPPETDLIATIGPMIGHADTLIARLSAADLSAADQADMTDLNTTIAGLMPDLQKLAKLQAKISEEFYRKNQRVYRTTSQNFVLLALLALVLAIGMCFYITRDITGLISNLEKSNQSLAESEWKYRYLFDNAPVIMTIWDPQTSRVLELNRKATEAYGPLKEEPHMLADFNREEQQKDMQVLQGFIKEIAAHKNAMSRKIWHYTGSDGEMAYMDIISHGIQYNGRDAMLVIVEDVTGQQRAEDNMKKMSEQVNELNEHLLAALEEERTYLERQIQDDLAAALAAVKTDISGIESDLATHGPPPAERFARIHQHIDLAANNIQRIISYLRTPLKF